MRSLFDVNVLIALFDEIHSHHEVAREWFAQHVHEGWATCSITQNGLLRILSQPRYPNPRPIAQVAQKLRSATQTDYHEFWNEDLSILQEESFDVHRIHSSKQLTDIYLLGLAVHNTGRFVTFDHSIAVSAVKRFNENNLIVI